MAREQPMAGASAMSMTAIPSLAADRRARLSRQLQRQVIPRIVLILVCALFLLPFYWMVNTALKTTGDLLAYPPLLWPTELTWSNFRDAVEYFPFWPYLRNTSIITALTIIGSIISNPIIAYGFSRIEWPGRDQIFYLVLATVFIPFPVLIVALFDIFAKTAASCPRWVAARLGGELDQHLSAAGGADVLRQRLLDLSHAAVHDADPARDLRCGAHRRRQRVPHLLSDRPPPGAARHRGHQHLRRPPRLERFSRPADLPPGRGQVHPLHRAHLLSSHSARSSSASSWRPRPLSSYRWSPSSSSSNAPSSRASVSAASSEGESPSA